ncbi:MAG: hypothetical protein KAS32_11325 [Candidatus Peribacteraceae bacterium]|nr:hypothetical protein [Candidatus Peribacteraceae bacterium]
MSQTQKSSGTIPTGKQIYDGIMKNIEPDLLSDNLSKIKEQHAGETEEEHKERMERYKVAFAKYDELYVQWLTRVKTAVKEKREEARKKAEIMSDTEDEVILQNIESSFSESST